ncbi:MAG TPA: winged helix-turn-helix domain-containing protein [Streptosporangiaceae bacterium]
MAELDMVRHDLPEPAYQQLAGILSRRITAGQWRSGPLPSVKALQGEFGVGRDTVLHALRLLRDAEVIFTVPKRGSYVGHLGR